MKGVQDSRDGYNASYHDYIQIDEPSTHLRLSDEISARKEAPKKVAHPPEDEDVSFLKELERENRALERELKAIQDSYVEKA